jgi:hypothetical protein
MPANLHRPNPPDSEERFHPAPLGYEALECGSKVSIWHPKAWLPAPWASPLPGSCPTLFPPVSDGLVSKP